VAEAKLSSKDQIVVAREARKGLKLKAGDKLLVAVRGDVLLITRKPRSFSKRIQGMANGLYPPDYLGRERKSWD
jgi:bifunctional DNA-binding transcriptional regulator/antitoxin component of YhaV-PrlF toxin-antitoxin module